MCPHLTSYQVRHQRSGHFVSPVAGQVEYRRCEQLASAAVGALSHIWIAGRTGDKVVRMMPLRRSAGQLELHHEARTHAATCSSGQAKGSFASIATSSARVCRRGPTFRLGTAAQREVLSVSCDGGRYLAQTGQKSSLPLLSCGSGLGCCI